MAIPKSVTRVNKDGVTFVDNVARTQYTLEELTRAALRDTGKYVCSRFRMSYYSHFKRKKRRVWRYTQYWVRKREGNLQVGVKPNGFYGLFLGPLKYLSLLCMRNQPVGLVKIVVLTQLSYLLATQRQTPYRQF